MYQGQLSYNNYGGDNYIQFLQINLQLRKTMLVHLLCSQAVLILRLASIKSEL